METEKLMLCFETSLSFIKFLSFLGVLFSMCGFVIDEKLEQ